MKSSVLFIASLWLMFGMSVFVTPGYEWMATATGVIFLIIWLVMACDHYVLLMLRRGERMQEK